MATSRGCWTGLGIIFRSELLIYHATGDAALQVFEHGNHYSDLGRVTFRHFNLLGAGAGAGEG